jgi:hypothetical protein
MTQEATMPKDDAPEYAVCDGCGIERADVGQVGAFELCDACEDIHRDDPPVTIHGRTLLLSEMKRQIEAGDVDLKAALDGDTVQEQIHAAHADARARSKAD